METQTFSVVLKTITDFTKGLRGDFVRVCIFTDDLCSFIMISTNADKLFPILNVLYQKFVNLSFNIIICEIITIKQFLIVTYIHIFKSFNEYFSAEHSRLLSLWRAVVAFRRQFGEMKTATERDMSHLRSDITRASRSMHSACLNLSANMRNTDTQTQVNVHSMQ